MALIAESKYRHHLFLTTPAFTQGRNNSVDPSGAITNAPYFYVDGADTLALRGDEDDFAFFTSPNTYSAENMGQARTVRRLDPALQDYIIQVCDISNIFVHTPGVARKYKVYGQAGQGTAVSANPIPTYDVAGVYGNRTLRIGTQNITIGGVPTPFRVFLPEQYTFWVLEKPLILESINPINNRSSFWTLVNSVVPYQTQIQLY
jgi:hypothetical protein